MFLKTGFREILVFDFRQSYGLPLLLTEKIAAWSTLTLNQTALFAIIYKNQKQVFMTKVPQKIKILKNKKDFLQNLIFLFFWLMPVDVSTPVDIHFTAFFIMLVSGRFLKKQKNAPYEVF